MLKASMRNGFTLLELLIVISITFILSTLSYSVIHDLLNQAKDYLLQSQLTSNIQLAAQAVQALHAPISMCKSDNQQTCEGNWINGQIIFVDINKNGKIENPTQIIATKHMLWPHGQLYWRTFPFYRHYILFDTNQKMLVNNGTFWHCHDKNTNPLFALMINKKGETHLIYPDKTGIIRDNQGKPLLC